MDDNYFGGGEHDAQDMYDSNLYFPLTQSLSPFEAIRSPAPLVIDESEAEATPMPSSPMTPFTLPPPRVPASLAGSCDDEWAEIIREHDSLLANKGQINNRKFNKTVLALLAKCVQLAKSGGGSSLYNPPPKQQQQQWQPMPVNNPIDWENPKEVFGEFRALLLNAREMASEELVERVVTYIEHGLPPLLTADEKKEELQKKSLALIQELSPQMSIKTAPVIKSYIARQFGTEMDDMLAQVRVPEMSLREKTLIYSRMFVNFFDDASCVSFAATNRQLLGLLTPADVWFLTFFAFVTTRRSRGDNLLMLGCVGKSSVGKSLLFESIILVTGHQLVSSSSSSSGDAGVGRFQTGSKNTVVFHDINIATLVGVDVERVKSLARSETTVVKIHSSTSTVSPMFVFYTSNERLFKHTISAHASGSGLPLCFPSQAEAAGKKRMSPENLEAVRARFLELLVHKTPKQHKDDLERCGTFCRENFILGTFDRALTLLEKYRVTDFHSVMLPAYVISGLTKNAPLMESTMCCSEGSEDCVSRHTFRLDRLRQKFGL